MRKKGNGEGSITKRPNGHYMGQVTIGRESSGKLIRKTIYGKTRKEVADEINKMLADVRQGLPVGDSTMVGDYLKRWLEDSVKPSVRQFTYDGYAGMVKNHIVPALGTI